VDAYVDAATETARKTNIVWNEKSVLVRPSPNWRNFHFRFLNIIFGRLYTTSITASKYSKIIGLSVSDAIGNFLLASTYYKH